MIRFDANTQALVDKLLAGETLTDVERETVSLAVLDALEPAKAVPYSDAIRADMQHLQKISDALKVLSDRAYDELMESTHA